MRSEFQFLSANGKTQIHAVQWTVETPPKAILQICHGMAEYILRYDRFASYLNEQGILVVGCDHLGHGKSTDDQTPLGYFARPDGLSCAIADQHTLRRLTQEKYPDVPYFLLGHSMGSFFARQYLSLHAQGLAGAVIMGTGTQPGAVLLGGLLITRLIGLFRGWKHPSPFVDKLAFSANNKAFEPARTPCDWLSRDNESVDAYCADPLCGYLFTANGFDTLFSTIRFIQNKKNIAKIPKDLPILLVSGACDPVGNFGEGVRAVYETYRAAGMTRLDCKLYPDDRHEILNELDRETVFSDLSAWIRKNQSFADVL